MHLYLFYCSFHSRHNRQYLPCDKISQNFPRCFTPLFDSLALFVRTSVNSAGLGRNGVNRQFEIGQCNDSGKKRRSLRKTKPSGETLKFILFFGHSLTAYSARSARDSTQEYPILYFPFNIPNAAPSCHRI